MNEDGRPESETTRRRNPIVAFGTWILPAMLAVVLILPLRSAIADWNDVPSSSMWPTILDGDRIFVDKLAYGLRLPFSTTWLSEGDAPERGDIVTFASPKDGARLVKRIVGVPGDRISMSGNQLIVNGELLDYDEIERATVSGLQDGRDLGVIELLQVTEFQNLAIARGEQLQRCTSATAKLLLDQFLDWTGCTRGEPIG